MLRNKLKEATASLHSSLETEMNIMGVKTREKLVSLLERMLHFYSSVEPMLKNYKNEWSDFQDNMESRFHKSEAIREDLIRLGLNSEIQNNQSHLEVNNFAEAVGAMYVIEGSTLGGQVITKHLKSALDLNDENTINFFDGYGPKTGFMWQSFVKSLDEYGEKNPQLHDQVIVGANKTFKAMAVTLKE